MENSKINSFHFQGLVICFFLLCYASMSETAEWIHYGSDESVSEFSYDKKSISYTSEDVVWVWTKMNPTPSGKEELMKKTSLEFSYSFNLQEIDCSTKKIRLLYRILYDSNGIAIKTIKKEGSGDMPDSQWDYIAPDTINENLHNILCLQPIKK